jgi:hypothetical protein
VTALVGEVLEQGGMNRAPTDGRARGAAPTCGL